MTTLAICSLISLLLAFVVVYKPLMKDKEQAYHQGDEQEAHRFNPQLALLEAISELEQDYQLGHLNKEEFERLQLEYQRDYLSTQHPPKPAN